MKIKQSFLLFLLISTSLFAQGGYVFRNVTLPGLELRNDPRGLYYPAYASDVAAVGMGAVQTAGGNPSIGMLSNPALLGLKKNQVDVFGIQTGFPQATWDAAWFLESHMDEFEDAISLNQIWDGVNAFFEPGATVNDLWAALQDIHQGMEFIVDLVNEVSGPVDDPNKYDFMVIPGIGAQIGNWGISVYGYGQASFLMQQSPALQALASVDIPEDLTSPTQAASSILKILGILGSSLLAGGSFAPEIFPVAYYISYMDIVGAVGYGMPVMDWLRVGANLKIINRRFSLDRIDVSNYDRILGDAFSDLTKSVTGVTLDLGVHATLPFGTDVGLALINAIPMQTIEDKISMNFTQHSMGYDLDGGVKQVDINGDTMMVRYKMPVELIQPFELKLPLLLNAGVRHNLTQRWSVGLDWLDILENDERLESTFGRIRFGTEYTQPVWTGKFSVTGRLGFGDEHICGGIGFDVYNTLYIDGAYAWDPIVDAYAIHAQMRVRI